METQSSEELANSHGNIHMDSESSQSAEVGEFQEALTRQQKKRRRQDVRRSVDSESTHNGNDKRMKNDAETDVDERTERSRDLERRFQKWIEAAGVGSYADLKKLMVLEKFLEMMHPETKFKIQEAGIKEKSRSSTSSESEHGGAKRETNRDPGNQESMLICVFLLHQHHRRSALRRGAADNKEDAVSCKQQVSPPCNHTPNLLELQLLTPPKANGQPAWTKNPNIAGVDVLQVDAASETSSMEHQRRSGFSVSVPDVERGGGKSGGTTLEKGKQNGVGGKRAPGSIPPAGDHLRNYAYEGDGSSPGSLSSCLESCSGSAKFLGGFREVAHMLES
ncbi:uncharacterized protein [Procambarus clarkii]|uniref:uncharacterized protein n=1 Tax=Procambarus clarkii TaxID=6728 RepID=UPI0037433AEE